jgi:hypothetical protein
MYKVDTRIWVEPTTGALIKGSQIAQRWFVDPTTGENLAPASDTTLTWTPAYVQETADDVSKQASQLKMAKVTIPIFGPILGILLVVGGILLLRKPPEKPAAAATGTKAKPTAKDGKDKKATTQPATG